MNKAKDEIENIVPNVEYEVDEVGMYAKEMIKLSEEDLEVFNKLYKLLDDIEDVSEIYTNVKMD